MAFASRRGTASVRRAVPGGLCRLASLALLALALIPASASAELAARGDLFVSFNGGLSPVSLPRTDLAPIGVRIDGVVKSFSGQRPPALRRIAVELNRGGVIDTRGLPRCRQGQLVSSSSRQAMETCGDALVGKGSYSARTAFPEQGAFPANGRILAFNALIGGRRAIIAHIFGSDPVPMTRLVIFHISHRAGTYGTVLKAYLPVAVNRYGYVKRISLSLFRRFTFQGREHSYLSAACPAPSGFPGAVFPFARTSMGFADGRKLSSTLTRTCRVRDR